VTSSSESTPDRTPAERRLDEHLELLRVEPAEPGKELVVRTVRAARWQRVLREPLRVVGMIAAAAFHGLAQLLGAGRRSSA